LLTAGGYITGGIVASALFCDPELLRLKYSHMKDKANMVES